MSYRRDYFKKQIDELGQVLNKLLSDLLKLKNDGNINGGMERTNEVLQKEIALDLQQLLSIPEDTFIEELKNKKIADDNLNRLADILLELAENTTEGNTQQKEMLYKKSLLLLEHVQRSDSTYSMERHEKIERIKKIS
jgi:hypothetical protein